MRIERPSTALPTSATMSQPVASSPTTEPLPPPPSDYDKIFGRAITDYKKQTGQDPRIASRAYKFESPDAVLLVLRDKVDAFDFRDGSKVLMDWLESYVYLVFTVSEKLRAREGSTEVPPSLESTICAAIVHFLDTAYQVVESYDSLVELFDRLQFFLQRIDNFTEIFYNTELKVQLLEVMADALSNLARSIKKMKEKPIRKVLKTVLPRINKDVRKMPRRMSTLNELEGKLLSESRSSEGTRHDSSSALVTIAEPTHDAGDSLARIPEAGPSPHADDGKAVTGDPTKLAPLPAEPGTDRKIKGGSTDKLPLIERDKLREWITPPDYAADHEAARKGQHPGTGKWFIDKDKDKAFKPWKKDASSLLICGKPGSGKTILCSSIIEEVKRSRDKSDMMAYYYFNSGDPDKRNLWGLLTSLVTQLGEGSDRYLTSISQSHTSHRNGSEPPSENELARLLKGFPGLQTQYNIYIIIDGVDKCPNTGATGAKSARRKVLEFLEDLARSRYPNLHLCITSSPEEDMERYLNLLASSSRDRRVNLDKQDAQKEDIKRYISHFVKEDVGMQKWPDGIKEDFIDTLSERGDGNFGWIFRRLDTLRGSLNVPEEVGTPLDETFEEALHGIPKEKYPDAFRLFQCLVAAPRSRPLELKEIVDIFSTYPDAAPSEEAVLAACPALVAIEEQDSKKIVRFSHRPESVIADFLTSKRLRDLKPKTISETDKSDISRYHFSLEDANATLSQACIKVLLQFDEMSKKEDLTYSPLALYAAQRWVEHTQFGKVASKNLEVMKSLLDPNESHLEAWIWMHDVDKGRSRTVDELALRPPLRNARKAAPLYYAALCGFSELVTFLATTYGDLNNERGYHGTPLHAASYKGHLDAVRALIDRGANPDAAIRNKTPLHAAYFGGRLATMELLLNMGAKVNETGASDKDETPGASGKDTKGASGNTVLHYASLDGRLDVIEVLFVRNADINAKNPNGWTPLHGAALRGQVDVARRLLKEVTKRLNEREDDPNPLRQEDFLNAPSRNGNTPLHVAAIAGKLEVVDLLLKKKAKTDLAGEYGWTPVQAAEENRHDEIARLLGRGDLRRFVGSVSNQVSNRVSSTVSSTLRPLRQIHL